MVNSIVCRTLWRISIICLYVITVIANFILRDKGFFSHHKCLWMFGHGHFVYLSYINMVSNCQSTDFNQIINQFSFSTFKQLISCWPYLMNILERIQKLLDPSRTTIFPLLLSLCRYVHRLFTGCTIWHTRNFFLWWLMRIWFMCEFYFNLNRRKTTGKNWLIVSGSFTNLQRHR